MPSSSKLTVARILVVDDEPDLRTLYELTLLRAGYQVQTAADLAQARQLLAQQSFVVVITDMRLPDGLGLALIQEIKAQQRSERCIVITAFGSAENAVESLKAGAFDYLTKPVDLKQFRTVVASAMQDPRCPAASASTASGASAAHESLGHAALERLCGESACMRELKERIVKVARSMAPVLIRGESGSGKELVARALHANSHRCAGALVAVNCSAIPENLLEAEFFGALQGAYTGATRDRTGFFQAANGGTLLLDEIGDLPLSMQAKLLRAIQERCIRPLGSAHEEPIDVRIVSATHKDLAVEVLQGRFRQDLYYRLNVIELLLPPLRERRSDLPQLCRMLLQRIATEAGIAVPTLSATALEQLSYAPLPGNVRELENLLQRAVALSDGDGLQMELQTDAPARASVDAVASTTVASDIPHDLQNHLDQQEREILIQALQAANFNRTVAATRLGISLRQMRYRIARLHIETPHAGDGSHDGD